MPCGPVFSVYLWDFGNISCSPCIALTKALGHVSIKYAVKTHSPVSEINLTVELLKELLNSILDRVNIYVILITLAILI
jgi:hypothetical protein